MTIIDFMKEHPIATVAIVWTIAEMVNGIVNKICETIKYKKGDKEEME